MSNAELSPRPTAENLDAVIGANVHQLMWRAQDRQTTIGPLLGMTQAALSLKLRGKRPWFASEIDAAARHYGVSRDALFTRLPDLDSNQEPAGSQLAPVISIMKTREHLTPSPRFPREAIITAITGH